MGAVTIPEDLVDLLEGGASMFVGTRDASLQPEATKAAGATVSRDRGRVTVYLPDPAAARAVANLRENPEIAVGFSRAMDAISIQVKGRSVDVRLATEAERTTLLRYHAAYVEQLYMIGLPRNLTSRFKSWPAHAVTFDVEDIFVQTPGPGAGKRLDRA